ncbi:MAG: FeoB-associated Cys-rich membrane protein [Chloracidobacterium sp.]|nr:FeoB-associated Cys-rich membrane protein [Chloracidobacterium sp.]MBP9936786.1 FeoB-associated Cys-rich membrane protein [Pyrinomonadaceae bacterium]MBK7802723.1 FeoB-associated Cys-rich membrane protein [Chloracidobacterium sp.]MBK9437577.1 FeoB-associated Cys-rich membrane protein [Chloracidobacterium sp.]MBK9767150.1 FeoB-associated Cys-rich membrane protein [Chloracidobacterium sp.]
MSIQTIIVFAIIAAAAFYGAVTLWHKRRSFSTKSDCSHDCGCGETTHKPKS